MTEYTKDFRHPGQNPQEPYVKWRLSLGLGLYTCDLDCIEYKVEDDVPEPVAFTELTHAYTNVRNEKMLAGAWSRLNPDGGGSSATSTQILRSLSNRVGVPAFITVHQPDMKEFAVRSLSDDDHWHFLDQKHYVGFLRRLRSR